MTWREMLDSTLHAAHKSVQEVRRLWVYGDLLYEVGAIWDRGAEAQEFPDAEAPDLDDFTSLLVESRVDEILVRAFDAWFPEGEDAEA